MSTGKVIVGVLAGAVLGGVFGVLFAPDKGSVTRRKMFSNDSLDELQTQLDDLYESIADKMDEYEPQNDLVIIETSRYDDGI